MSADQQKSLAAETVFAFFAAVEVRDYGPREALVELETFVAISIMNIAISTGQPNRRAYVSEILDMMTANCMMRLNNIFEQDALK